MSWLRRGTRVHKGTDSVHRMMLIICQYFRFSDKEDVTREEPATASNITPGAVIEAPTEEPSNDPQTPITPPTTTPLPSVGVEGGASEEVADNIDPVPVIEHKETNDGAGDNVEATGGEDLPTPTKQTEGETNGEDVVAQVPSAEPRDIASVGGIGTEGGAIQHHASSPTSHSLVAIPQVSTVFINMMVV